MQALRLTATWPVPHVSAAVLITPTHPVSGEGLRATHPSPQGVVDSIGDVHREYRLASIAKPITAWAVLIAVEEGLLTLDTPIGQPGCTLRHLLAHAGGYPFDGPDPITTPGKRRIYSNTGIEMAAAAVAEAADMPFEVYLREAVLEPLGMGATTLRGSPAHAMWSTVDDLVRFAAELIEPRLLSAATASEATSPAFPELSGVLPGVGRYTRCSWGLGLEIKGDKAPHWTGPSNSPATFGHFGGSGTLLWVDVGALDDRTVACVALTDRPFDDWAPEALRLWPSFSEAVLAEASNGAVS
jgi:CubicO group peptidase (beta-lactamase class C family)